MMSTRLVVVLLALAFGLAAQEHAGQIPVAPDKNRRDHVGQPVPEYLTGDECLFCHRVKPASTWQSNAHAWTIRPVGVPPAVPQPAAGATHVIGSASHFRALKLTGYGRFALLSPDGKTWQPDVFRSRCAGCHTTAVDPATHAFSAFALDCYTCHGAVPLAHSGNPSLAWLSHSHGRPPREIVAICGQCHLRGGRSRSTGLPYPNNFVAGDDLFADFQVDLNRADDASFNATDRHVYTKTRAVVERGSKVTCLNCHPIHVTPTGKRRIPELHSEVCDY